MNDLAPIAATLRRLADRIDGNNDATWDFGVSQAASYETTKLLIDARRLLADHVDPDLFADPGRDILLDLYASELSGRSTCMSSCCNGVGVPATTATRWVALLEQRRLIVKEPDPQDDRRFHVRLSAEGAELMSAYLADVVRLMTRAVKQFAG